MPSGVFKVIDIPDDKVATVIADYEIQSPVSIKKEKQPNGLTTVIATFPGTTTTIKNFPDY